MWVVLEKCHWTNKGLFHGTCVVMHLSGTVKVATESERMWTSFIFYHLLQQACERLCRNMVKTGFASLVMLEKEGQKNDATVLESQMVPVWSLVLHTVPEAYSEWSLSIGPGESPRVWLWKQINNNKRMTHWNQ